MSIPNYVMFRPYVTDINNDRYNFFCDLWENKIILSDRDRIQVGRHLPRGYRYRKITCVYGYQKPAFRKMFRTTFDIDRFTLHFKKNPHLFSTEPIDKKDSVKRWISGRPVYKNKPVHTIPEYIPPEKKGKANSGIFPFYDASHPDEHYRRHHIKNPRIKTKKRKVFIPEKGENFGRKKSII